MWFRKLTGFAEEHPDQVRANLEIDGHTLTSRVNGRTMAWGRFEIPRLDGLRERLRELGGPRRPLVLREVVADVQHLHCAPSNAGATFQVASQFNLLEMVSPGLTPEDGIDRYEDDRTQGPACAIACGAGTIYRNYFAEVAGRIGQSARRQIDCLADLGEELGNRNGRLWSMRNGYALASEDGLRTIRDILQAADDHQRDHLRRLLRVGVQWDTEVTLRSAGHTVTQVYGSALPVAYSPHRAEDWAPFATLVLEASYEATFAVAALQAARGGSTTLFLTLLGGGAFGNHPDWILGAIARAADRFSDSGLEVAIVSYGASHPLVADLVAAR